MAGVLSGCADQGAIKPAEVLDERTGVTVGALHEPIEFVTASENATLSSGRRSTFAYLGPIEWDRMGDISYALWIHVAPGNDRQIADIRAPGAATLILDGGPVELSPIETPGAGQGPYRPVVSWGQTAYFALNVPLLKRMADSRTLVLNLHAADGSVLDFTPNQDTHRTLTQFNQARGITGD